MQDKSLELRIKLRVIKETPEYLNIIADMLDIPINEALLKIAQIRFKYQKELKEILDRQETENQKQQKLF